MDCPMRPRPEGRRPERSGTGDRAPPSHHRTGYRALPKAVRYSGRQAPPRRIQSRLPSVRFQRKMGAVLNRSMGVFRQAGFRAGGFEPCRVAPAQVRALRLLVASGSARDRPHRTQAVRPRRSPARPDQVSKARCLLPRWTGPGLSTPPLQGFRDRLVAFVPSTRPQLRSGARPIAVMFAPRGSFPLRKRRAGARHFRFVSPPSTECVQDPKPCE